MGELLLYAAKDAKIQDFQSGGAAILADHVMFYTQKEREKIRKDITLKHGAEESIAEIELVAEMYANLLGIENQYTQAKRSMERAGDMTP
jgi:hypothetical protein